MMIHENGATMKLIRGIDDDDETDASLYKERKSLLDNTKLKELFEKQSLDYTSEIYGNRAPQARSLDNDVLGWVKSILFLRYKVFFLKRYIIS